MSEKKERFKLLNNILKEKDKYSQGRVYLLISIVAYYITLGTLMACGIWKSEIDIENFTIIVEALEYAMTLFGGYVFGGKFIEVIKVLKENNATDSEMEG
jgi:hypothetical protein